MDAFLIDLLISQHSVNNSEAFDIYRPIIYVHNVPLKNNLQSFFWAYDVLHFPTNAAKQN